MTDQSTNPSIMESKPRHPLHQIAETPTHKLLLKQWLKEEELLLGRSGFGFGRCGFQRAVDLGFGVWVLVAMVVFRWSWWIDLGFVVLVWD
uniref:Uncharacterized protein n=1 Tax=Fagus sylvatica TaxID=28930 RepID=A0A2N9EY14_FAGSY